MQTNSEPEMKLGLYLALSGQTAIRLDSIENSLDNPAVTFQAMVTELTALFCPESESLMAQRDFKARRQEGTENIMAYLADKLCLFNIAYPEGHAGRDTRYFLEELVCGLYHSRSKVLLYEKREQLTIENYASTIYNCIANQAMIVEKGLSDTASPLGLYTSAYRTPMLPRGGEVEPMEIGMINKDKTRTCFNCNSTSHLRAQCPQERRTQAGPSSGQSRNTYNRPPQKGTKVVGNCNRCLTPGHHIKNCKVSDSKLESRRQINIANRKKVQTGGRNIRQLESHEETVGEVGDRELVELLRGTDIGEMRTLDFHQGLL